MKFISMRFLEGVSTGLTVVLGFLREYRLNRSSK